MPEDLIHRRSFPPSPLGVEPEKRPLEKLIETGIVIVDKPPGPSSHEVASWVKTLLGASKAGHAGTLDPDVSGVLPVALGRATPLLQYLTDKDKTYVCIIRFSRRLPETEIRRLFSLFVGEISQLPPKEAAVARRWRKRNIYYINPIQIESTDVLFEAKVQAGTYIRTLCSDVGKLCGGARMLELRRTDVGTINEGEAVRLSDLADAIWLAREKRGESEIRRMVFPAERRISLRKIMVSDAAVSAVCHGSPVYMPGVAAFSPGISAGEKVTIVTQKGELAAIGCAAMPTDEMKVKQKGMAAKAVRVVMEKEAYPKAW
jgi:H/ACA ribonucleoprotein complex subunit 4